MQPQTPIAYFLDELRAMPLGFPHMVADRVVTRWETDRYEVDTFGDESAWMPADHVATWLLGKVRARAPDFRPAAHDSHTVTEKVSRTAN